MAKQDFIVGLDIGTTKICAIIGQITANELDIIGIGTRPSKGIRKGVVVNIDSTVSAIRGAVKEAELMAGCEAHSAYVGVAGSHIKSFNSTGVVAVKGREIERSDIERVIDAAKAIAIPADREVMHVVPQDYIVDGQDGIKDPIGMSGVRLEGKMHIVTAGVSSTQNILKCANRAGIQVDSLVLEPIASSEAVLSEDEKELGVALIDIGGGTSDISIFVSGALVHTAVIPVGGNHLTNDVAVGLRTPQSEAELIKMRHGSTIKELIKEEETIEVAGVGGRKPRIVSRRLLAEIISPRSEEIFQMTKREIDKSGFSGLLASGVVITGGTTMLSGMPEQAEMIFEMPVKRGFPYGIGGLHDVVNTPRYATAVGLVKYAHRLRHEKYQTLQKSARYSRFRSAMTSWLRDLF